MSLPSFLFSFSYILIFINFDTVNVLLLSVGLLSFSCGNSYLLPPACFLSYFFDILSHCGLSSRLQALLSLRSLLGIALPGLLSLLFSIFFFQRTFHNVIFQPFSRKKCLTFYFEIEIHRNKEMPVDLLAWGLS